MIVREIRKEIKDFKTPIVAGLDARKLFVVILVVAVCVPTYIFGIEMIGESLASWICIIIAVPLGAIGFVTYNGMKFEQIIIAWIKFNIIYPPKRKYESVNFFEELEKEYDRLENLENSNTKRRWRRKK